MEKYQQEFIEFLAESGALKFGQFTLKSGRLSPYFINAAVFNDGKLSAKLGYFFAKKITATLGEDYDILFGPAYKGIPLAVETSMALWKDFQINKPWAFDRKEEKAHGDKGMIVGKELKDDDRVIILDDVFTTGAAKEEVIEKIRAIAHVRFTAVFIAVDRQEKNPEGKNAIKEFEDKHEIPVHSVVTVRDAFAHLRNREIGGKTYVNEKLFADFEEYLQKYGI
jgi:orotate phosphoribosyltransferase